jgi:DNA-binding transcriptional ArsR family regulator
VRHLYEDPVAGLAELADSIDAYWGWAIEPYWPRIRQFLDGDLFHRARVIAQGGTRQLFADLHPQISWANGALTIKHRPGPMRSRTARGKGLLLLPSVFVWPHVYTTTTPPWQPALIYPARGAAALWETGTHGTAQALAAVVGRTKAMLLDQLASPATTTELAERAGLTTGGVSQHLTALRAAGLVTPNRNGRHVLYVRTALADHLVSAGADPEARAPRPTP